MGMLDMLTEKVQQEQESLPATYTILQSMNHEHKITRSYVIENGVKLDRLEERVTKIEDDVTILKADVHELKQDVST
ncbi:MAG: hypothetical protein HXX81_01445, partial [Campylobacterales bacterium]|nr:hypothetical protein [Campylobacterales bacterium]